MFLKKENGALRTRLAALESDRILGRITQESYNSQAADIVRMLEKLGEPLSAKEQELLRKVQRSLGGRQSSSPLRLTILCLMRRTRNRWVAMSRYQTRLVSD